jgi:hypothetical protein
MSGRGRRHWPDAACNALQALYAVGAACRRRISSPIYDPRHRVSEQTRGGISTAPCRFSLAYSIPAASRSAIRFPMNVSTTRCACRAAPSLRGLWIATARPTAADRAAFRRGTAPAFDRANERRKGAHR